MHGIAGLIDVETTGFSPIYDDVIEFSICLFKYKKDTGEILGIVEDYVGLQEPRKKIPYQATKVHGLKDNDVRGKALDYEKISSLLNQAEFFVAHNASFDRKFTENIFPLASNKPWLCSMNNINWRKKGFDSKGLQNLLKAHSIEVKRSHRAYDDVMATLTLLASRCSLTGSTYFRELYQSYVSESEAKQIKNVE